MKKITFLLSLIITSSIYAQSLEMPNIPAEGVNYETSTLDAYLSVSTEGPWDFTNLNPVDQSVISMQSIDDSPYSSSNYPNTTHVKYGTSGSQSVIQFPGFTSSGYTYNGENSIIVNNYATPLTINPYPVNDDFVTIQTPVNGMKYVEVFDITGKRLINTSLSADTLEVSSLSAGMYLIKVTVEGQSKTSKLIVR